MSHSKFVVLFDIDGTLVSGPPGRPSAGLYAMNRATESITGNQDLGDPREFAGRTDPQIAAMLLRSAGVASPSEAQVSQLLDHYVKFLRFRSEEVPYSALGDPQAAIASIRALRGSFGLGTGNLKAGASIKLESAGILKFFDIDKGGYGEDGSRRFEVLEKGVQRTKTNGSCPVVVVGDTPLDVQAAHKIGAHCIGVPHGHNTSEVLLASGADAIVDQVDERMGLLIQTLL